MFKFITGIWKDSGGSLGLLGSGGGLQRAFVKIEVPWP